MLLQSNYWTLIINVFIVISVGLLVANGNCEPIYDQWIILNLPENQQTNITAASTTTSSISISSTTTDQSNNRYIPSNASRETISEEVSSSTIEVSPSAVDYYPNYGWDYECTDEDKIYVSSEKKCLKKALIGEKCKSSEQCVVPQSSCQRERCGCIDYFVDYGTNKCTPIHNTAIEIYKITMIFASSCLALILLIFLACILRKSYCPTDSSHQGVGRSTMNDLFTIYPGTSESPNELFGGLTPAEKPPSYTETMRIINQEIGTPPPAYHNIFYSETSPSSPPTTTNNNHVNNNNTNERPSEVPEIISQSHHPLPANTDLLLITAPSSTSPRINAQNRNLYSLSQARVIQNPSAPRIVQLNQGQVNSAFSTDS